MGGPSLLSTVARLDGHPSHSVPKLPKVYVTSEAFNRIVTWTLESAARFISPSPKEDGENEEFECDDIAAALRGSFRDTLHTKYTSELY